MFCTNQPFKAMRAFGRLFCSLPHAHDSHHSIDVSAQKMSRHHLTETDLVALMQADSVARIREFHNIFVRLCPMPWETGHTPVAYIWD